MAPPDPLAPVARFPVKVLPVIASGADFAWTAPPDTAAKLPAKEQLTRVGAES